MSYKRISYRLTGLKRITTSKGKKNIEGGFPTFDSVSKRMWKFITSGLLGRITIPLTFIFIVLTFAFTLIDGQTKLAFYIKDIFDEKTSLLSKHEIEILNEWVVVVEYGDTYEQAVDRHERFTNAYLESRDIIIKDPIKDNILIVRDPVEKNRWLVVIDFYGGTSSCIAMAEEIRDLNSRVENLPVNNTIKDGFGMWIKNSFPLEYNFEKFQETYGRVLNKPRKMYSLNQNGQCLKDTFLTKKLGLFERLYK